jgi:hypothetical protein
MSMGDCDSKHGHTCSGRMELASAGWLPPSSIYVPSEPPAYWVVLPFVCVGSFLFSPHASYLWKHLHTHPEVCFASLLSISIESRWQSRLTTTPSEAGHTDLHSGQAVSTSQVISCWIVIWREAIYVCTRNPFLFHCSWLSFWFLVEWILTWAQVQRASSVTLRSSFSGVTFLWMNSASGMWFWRTALGRAYWDSGHPRAPEVLQLLLFMLTEFSFLSSLYQQMAMHLPSYLE